MGPMNVHGVAVPDFLYGTAWKEDATESLVLGALGVGFRGIDNANQRKHYFEEGVGRAGSCTRHARLRRAGEPLFGVEARRVAPGRGRRAPQPRAHRAEDAAGRRQHEREPQPVVEG